jgi:hypothetical protein
VPHSPHDPNAIRNPLRVGTQSGSVPLTSGYLLRAY